MKEKKSKFYGQAFPIQNENEVKPIIAGLKKKYHTAGHVCYAWQLGTELPRYRVNDDGEPNNSAGLPIYGQIQAFKLTNVIVAVARIFGGTKLGVGGLITAYREGAKMALEVATIIEKRIEDTFELSFGYPEMNKVMRVLKQRKCEIISQQMLTGCTLIVSVRKSESENFEGAFDALYTVAVKKVS
ncbi:MAG: YigZ family protein [Maribacter sp.]|uniref:IMPACT family protein n=1 Tax=Maribacter sp. TaxID=1897614 RepID=UPI003296B7CB